MINDYIILPHFPGNPLTEDEVDQVFAGQVNSDGQINIMQFVRHVLEA
jgi:Ca2+-binding EF-hand superfamily protein